MESQQGRATPAILNGERNVPESIHKHGPPSGGRERSGVDAINMALLAEGENVRASML